MKKLFISIAFNFCLLAVNGAAFAASERGTADEAVALVKKAVAYLKVNGKEKALVEFSKPTGQFIDRNLYIFVYDMNGTCVAIGNNPKMVGKNLIDLKDPDGVYQVRKFIEVANTAGKGWIDYKWPNPVTKTIERKSSYVEKAEDVVIGAGIYKE